jgi:hypothetical protein
VEHFRGFPHKFCFLIDYMATERIDWKALRDEITAHALAACDKFQIALGRAKEPPPLELGEAFEDAANEYLSIFEQISELHRRNLRPHNVTSIKALAHRSSAADHQV